MSLCWARDNDHRAFVLHQYGRLSCFVLGACYRNDGEHPIISSKCDPVGTGNYSPPAWRGRATEEQKGRGWRMAVRIEKILCVVLHDIYKQQVEETGEGCRERTLPV